METLKAGKKYQELQGLNLPKIEQEVLKFWKEQGIFEKSIAHRAGAKPFIFYEGPPSVNGMPGIHHVMGRTIKDIFCRYKSLKGYQVQRKAGWDTHGLPIELAVEKRLGITKEDIGKTISVEDYNARCREEALKYQNIWNQLTERMGYWVDMDNPYVTFHNDYIESLWNLLQRLYDKGLLYKGYTIQPYSPAAGSGLSSHELNQPGCYRDVTDTTATAQFKVAKDDKSAGLFEGATGEVFILAWTTTPWTLPSNTALAVGAKITYVQINTYNPYTHLPVSVILAKDLVKDYFKPEQAELALEDYEQGQKKIPYTVVRELMGAELEGMRYEQLLPYVQPDNGKAFIVVTGNFVTTESGTGIVHIAPSFGADDMFLSKVHGLGSLTLVDKRGRFVPEVTDFANRPVKNYDNLSKEAYKPVDVDIVIKLKQENKAFKVQKYVHSYPHCWRTDKPIVYYPLDSWFIKTTACKERLVELNKTINWKPKATGEGRFGNWLENLVDWNLSRSRFWGTPLPIWRTADGEKEICIGSMAQLKEEVAKSVEAGFMEAQLAEDFDLHRPYVDDIILVSADGEKMFREPDLIDVWFDSGAMPYAQWHYPFENKEIFEQSYPADFIAEGVDQTRGWFFTLHAIATMLFDSVAFKNVVSNGLLLDKNGVKMSKRLGNVVDPFEALNTYGADANRWYMVSNSQPWDNLRFSLDGVQEVQRKFFGTLFNTYSFFAIYANLDGFDNTEASIPLAERPEIDRWVISLLNTLCKKVDAFYADYEPTKAARLIQDFVVDHLSNWYVRLCRRRFWKGEKGKDKTAAYQTLLECLVKVCQLMSPISPFFSDALFRHLNEVTGSFQVPSVHLSDFPEGSDEAIDKALEERMQMAQDISSMILALRKKEKIRVRQPLQKILIPISGEAQQTQLDQVKDLILSEVNVKELAYLEDSSSIIKKTIKPDFRKLGRKLGRNMGTVKKMLETFDQTQIAQFEQDGYYELTVADAPVRLELDEVVIASDDIEGWLVNSLNGLTVALDITLTEELKTEGLAREFVSRLQKLRKELDFNLADRIELRLEKNEGMTTALEQFGEYITNEVLIVNLILEDTIEDGLDLEVEDMVLKVVLKVVA